MHDTTATLIGEVHDLHLKNQELRAALEESILRDIEHRNPGINIEAVRRYRKQSGASLV